MFLRFPGTIFLRKKGGKGTFSTGTMVTGESSWTQGGFQGD